MPTKTTGAEFKRFYDDQCDVDKRDAVVAAIRAAGGRVI